MSARSMMLMLALAGGAAYLYQRRPRGAFATAGGARPLAADAFGSGMARPDEHDRSLDRAELLEDEGRLGAPMAHSGDLAASHGESLRSVAPSSTWAAAPGVPDLTRGA